MAGRQPSGWNIVELEEFERGVAGLGGYRFVDEAIRSLTASLHSNPLAFDVPLASRPDIRLAKTTIIIGPRLIPALSLFFKVDEHTRTVFLLHIERTDPNDITDQFDED